MTFINHIYIENALLLNSNSSRVSVFWTAKKTILLVSSVLRKRRADREQRAEKCRMCAQKRTQITKFSPYFSLASRLKDVHALVL